VQSPFGNYIIQHIFDEWGAVIAKDLFALIKENIVALSMQKFSSNIIERIFDLVDIV
jgi:hypothetical protein